MPTQFVSMVICSILLTQLRKPRRPRNSVVRLINRPAVTLAVYRECKATNKQNFHNLSIPNIMPYLIILTKQAALNYF